MCRSDVVAEVVSNSNIKLTWQPPEVLGGWPLDHFDVYAVSGEPARKLADHMALRAPCPTCGAPAGGVHSSACEPVFFFDIHWEVVQSGVVHIEAETPTCETSIRAGTPYMFRVVAVNAAGLSRPSQPSAPVSTEGSDPGAPTVLRVEDLGHQMVRVVWHEPANDGGLEIAGCTPDFVDLLEFFGCTSVFGCAPMWPLAADCVHMFL
jgi:hypothetical protein